MFKICEMFDLNSNSAAYGLRSDLVDYGRAKTNNSIEGDRESEMPEKSE